MPRNSFETLCELGAKESWQLHPACGTCCSVNYRYAFAALATGFDPTALDWPIHEGNSVTARFGEMPPDALRLGEQGVLAGIISSADLLRLSRTEPFGNWLGVLNLVLQLTTDAERETGVLTARLVPQLARLCHGGVRDELLRKFADPNRRLEPADLVPIAQTMEETQRNREGLEPQTPINHVWGWQVHR